MPGPDVKGEEKKAAATETREEVMGKVLSHGAYSIGYLAGSGLSGKPSDAYNFEASNAGNEFKKLHAELLSGAGDAKTSNRDAKIEVADQLNRVQKIVKARAAAVLDGDTNLYEKKEAEAKAAYTKLASLVETKGLEEEKKKVEGLQKKIEEAEKAELARESYAYHERARQNYLRNQYRGKKDLVEYEQELRKGKHSDSWYRLGESPIKLGTDVPKDGISTLSEAGSELKTGIYYNDARQSSIFDAENYMIEIAEQRDNKGKLTGLKSARAIPPIPGILWEHDSGVGLLMGGRWRYKSLYTTQIRDMITLLRPEMKNQLGEVKDEKGEKSLRLRANAGYVIDPPDRRGRERADIRPSRSFHELKWAFDEVKKVKPPIAFSGSKAWFDFLNSQVDKGPFAIGVKAYEFGSDTKRNIKMLKELEKQIAGHNQEVERQLKEHAVAAEKLGKDKVEAGQKEQKYVEGLVAAGKGSPPKALTTDEEKEVKLAVHAAKAKEEKTNKRPLTDGEMKDIEAAEERKIYLVRGARAEVETVANAKAADGTPHLDKIDQARNDLVAAMRQVGDFVANIEANKAEAKGSAIPMPLDWENSFPPPAEAKEKWAAAVASPAKSEDIATYLVTRAENIKQYNEEYKAACNAWKPIYTDFNAHRDVWLKALGNDAEKAGKIEQGAPNLDVYGTKELDDKMEALNAKVHAITTPPDIKNQAGDIVKGENPLRISQEIKQLEHQVTAMRKLDAALALTVGEIWSEKYNPAVHGITKPLKDENLQKLVGDAKALVTKIKQLAQDINITYRSYQENKKAWENISPDLTENIRNLESKMQNVAREGGTPYNKLEIKDNGKHTHSEHYEWAIANAYNQQHESLEKEREQYEASTLSVSTPSSPSASGTDSDSEEEEKRNTPSAGP